MPEVTIRELEREEQFEITHQLGGYAFHASPPLIDHSEWQHLLDQRVDDIYLALFVDGTPVACAICSPMTQNIRGNLYPMGGMWGVTTHPSMRRKGYARQIVAHMFTMMHERKWPVSVLYPFRESFYERLGYTLFHQPRIASFDPTVLFPLISTNRAGSVELVSMQEHFATYFAYLQHQQKQIHGMALFSEKASAAVHHKHNVWLALAQVNNELVGAMAYSTLGEGMKMHVQRFYYSDSRGKYLLLEWCARHIDQSRPIEIFLPPTEHPETWFADMKPSIRALDAPMGRIIDVTQLGGMNTQPGYFHARIHDAQCPWNEGCYCFETVDGKLSVTPADEATCDLTIHALSALVYGTHDPDDFAFRGWGNPSAEIQGRMRKMFPPASPFLHEVY